MNNILVTGADGFIGRNLVCKLLELGKEVYAVVYPGNNIYEGNNNDKLHVKCMDLNQVMNHVREFPEDIDVMYHLAWMGVRPEVRNDLDVQMINLNMTIDCMKLAIAIGIKKIVFPGSTNEYLYYIFKDFVKIKPPDITGFRNVLNIEIIQNLVVYFR